MFKISLQSVIMAGNIDQIHPRTSYLISTIIFIFLRLKLTPKDTKIAKCVFYVNNRVELFEPFAFFTRGRGVE